MATLQLRFSESSEMSSADDCIVAAVEARSATVELWYE